MHSTARSSSVPVNDDPIQLTAASAAGGGLASPRVDMIANERDTDGRPRPKRSRCSSTAPISTPPPSRLGFDIDYKRLLREFQSRGYLLRAFYYTAVIEDQEYSSIRPLIDWLDYNGYTVVTKATKEFVDQTGRRKVKGNMDIELAVDAMEIAAHIDHMVLFSGDGDFRSLVEAVQRRGVRVTVVSTISTQPPMVADELRRQADIFLDIVELQPKIGRDPAERAAARAARAARAAQHTPQFLQRGRRARSAPAPAPRRRFRRLIRRLNATVADDRRSPASPAATARSARASSRSATIGARASRTGSTRRSPRSARSTRGSDRRPCARAARREPHRPAVHRRLRRRPALRHADAFRLRPRQLRGAARRRAELVDARITNAVRCVPPENKPTPRRDQRPAARSSSRRIAEMPKLRAIVALGRIAHDSVAGGARRSSARPRRSGTARRTRSASCALFDSYHCSRYNTNTGVLTPEMFRAVFADVRALSRRPASQATTSSAFLSGGNTG